MIFNTGTAVTGGAPLVTSQAITIPAGVRAGDIIIVAFAAFNNTAAETVQASSTGTAPSIIGSSQTAFNGGFSANALHAAIFVIVATASDAGKVITGSLVSGDTAQWAASLGAWTGASASAPVDVNGAAMAVGNNTTITCPAEITGIANDWDLQILAAALAGSAYTGGAGFTQRESLVDGSSGAGTAIFDSNGSVGPAGTGIGGATFANAGNNSWWIGWTIGLAPAAGGGGDMGGRPPSRRYAAYAHALSRVPGWRRRLGWVI